MKKAMILSILLALAGCTSSHGPGGGTDADGDGYASDVDCNDDNDAVYPGAPENCEDGCERWGDGLDNNCNGEIDEYEACYSVTCNPIPEWFDRDGDGFDENVDCNDDDPSIHPGAEENCENGCEFTGDGIDNNCDGNIDEYDACLTVSCNVFIDNDGDGWGEGFGPGPDCDDTDPNIHPEAEETECDGVDSNCDGEDNPEGSTVVCEETPDP